MGGCGTGRSVGGLDVLRTVRGGLRGSEAVAGS